VPLFDNIPVQGRIHRGKSALYSLTLPTGCEDMQITVASSYGNPDIYMSNDDVLASVQGNNWFAREQGSPATFGAASVLGSDSLNVSIADIGVRGTRYVVSVFCAEGSMGTVCPTSYLITATLRSRVGAVSGDYLAMEGGKFQWDGGTGAWQVCIPSTRAAMRVQAMALFGSTAPKLFLSRRQGPQYEYGEIGQATTWNTMQHSSRYLNARQWPNYHSGYANVSSRAGDESVSSVAYLPKPDTLSADNVTFSSPAPYGVLALGVSYPCHDLTRCVVHQDPGPKSILLPEGDISTAVPYSWVYRLTTVFDEPNGGVVGVGTGGNLPHPTSMPLNVNATKRMFLLRYGAPFNGYTSPGRTMQFSFRVEHICQRVTLVVKGQGAAVTLLVSNRAEEPRFHTPSFVLNVPKLQHSTSDWKRPTWGTRTLTLDAELEEFRVGDWFLTVQCSDPKDCTAEFQLEVLRYLRPCCSDCTCDLYCVVRRNCRC
jgi:hypothetical protein